MAGYENFVALNGQAFALFYLQIPEFSVEGAPPKKFVFKVKLISIFSKESFCSLFLCLALQKIIMWSWALTKAQTNEIIFAVQVIWSEP